jgi:hypothetical protein
VVAAGVEVKGGGRIGGMRGEELHMGHLIALLGAAAAATTGRSATVAGGGLGGKFNGGGGVSRVALRALERGGALFLMANLGIDEYY